ncbi:calmodulin-like protein 6 [Platysternon megacephalum]|uniref:Calmodulin-like protein 6 n=1 Tax=Platysternon megacephalum TaxID=55544 RepID=A0A4D9ERT8_9SAUR|nr:calmodulin-like protein 6 [Platysternon megacephalum]
MHMNMTSWVRELNEFYMLLTKRYFTEYKYALHFLTLAQIVSCFTIQGTRMLECIMAPKRFQKSRGRKKKKKVMFLNHCIPIREERWLVKGISIGEGRQGSQFSNFNSKPCVLEAFSCGSLCLCIPYRHTQVH